MQLYRSLFPVNRYSTLSSFQQTRHWLREVGWAVLHSASATLRCYEVNGSWKSDCLRGLYCQESGDLLMLLSSSCWSLASGGWSCHWRMGWSLDMNVAAGVWRGWVFSLAGDTLSAGWWALRGYYAHWKILQKPCWGWESCLGWSPKYWTKQKELRCIGFH